MVGLGPFLAKCLPFLSIWVFFLLFWPIWRYVSKACLNVIYVLGDIWLVFVCYLGGICLWVVWFRSVWLQRSASIPLYRLKLTICDNIYGLLRKLTLVDILIITMMTNNAVTTTRKILGIFIVHINFLHNLKYLGPG